MCAYVAPSNSSRYKHASRRSRQLISSECVSRGGADVTRLQNLASWNRYYDEFNKRRFWGTYFPKKRNQASDRNILGGAFLMSGNSR